MRFRSVLDRKSNLHTGGRVREEEGLIISPFSLTGGRKRLTHHQRGRREQKDGGNERKSKEENQENKNDIRD